jgi:hypothetical protein
MASRSVGPENASRLRRDVMGRDEESKLSLLLTDAQKTAIAKGHVLVEAWSDGTYAARVVGRPHIAHGLTPRLAIEALRV